MYSECLLHSYAGKLRLNARRPAKSMPTYEQPTQWLLQIQMPFSPDGLIVNTYMENELNDLSVAGINSVQCTRESLVKCM